MNGDEIAFITKTSTGGAKTAVNVIYTSTRNIDDLAFPATSGRSIQVETDGHIHADLKEWLGTAPNALQTGRVDSYTGAMANDVIAAAVIATGAIDADSLAADVRAEIIGALGVEGVADAGGSTSTLVDAALTQADDFWNGSYILFTSGTNAGRIVRVTDFVAATDTITFAPTVGAAVGASDTYIILGTSFAQADLQTWLNTAPNALVAGAVDADVSAMQNDVVTAAAIANGAIDAATFAAGAIDAAAIGTGAIDADAIATDAITNAKIAADAIGDSEMAADAFDGMFVRDADQYEVAAPVHSLGMAVLKAVSRVRDNAGTLEVYRTDGTTLKASQTVTTDAANDPIDELSIAS